MTKPAREVIAEAMKADMWEWERALVTGRILSAPAAYDALVKETPSDAG